MPDVFKPARSAAQLARVLATRRKLLVISSHTRRLAGNALGLALAGRDSPDFNPVFLGARDTPGSRLIPTFDEKGGAARLLSKRAALIAYTGPRPPLASSNPSALRIFLWHGMPIKGIGVFDPLNHTAREPCDLAIATSECTAGIMARSFGLDPEAILICGEPKTDPLPADLPDWNFCSSLRQRYKTIIGYFPTWRERIVEINGRPRRRGDDAALGQFVSQLTADASLRDMLERHQTAFVIRMHVKHAAAKLSPPFFSMDDAQGDATHLLQECDAIVGDYSSVVIDALLFDRPLALWCEDIETYTQQRSLPYFDFRGTFGWAIKANLGELRDWIAARLESRPLSKAEADGLARCRALFHTHARGGAGERVLEAAHARLARGSS